MDDRPSRLEISLLGPPEVLIDGRPLHTDTRKAVALLAYLSQRETAPTRDHLVTLLWPDSSPERGRGALRRTVSTLRSALGGRWVVADRERVRLDLDGVTLDTDRLSEDAEAAVAAVRGRFLDGFWLRDAPDFDDWQVTTAEHYDHLVRRLLGEAVERSLGRGDTTGSLTLAERLVALDPLDEAGHRALMRAHAAAGDRVAATRQFRRCLAILETELAVEPLPETVDLHESILAGVERRAPTADPSPGPSVPTAPDLLGREEELAAVRRLTHRPGIVWVVGPEGSGRSRLVATALPRAVAVGARPGEAALPHALTRSILDALLGATDLARLDEAAAPAGHLHPGITARSVDPPPLDDELGPIRLLAGVAAAVAELAEGPLVVDDFDRADPASQDAIRFLAGRSNDLGVHLVVIADTAGGEGMVVEVGPLDDDVVVGLAAGSGLDAAALRETTGGLPGPIFEILSDPTPEVALARTRAYRVARLDPGTRQVLEGLVVLGSATMQVVAAVTGRGLDETSTSLDRLVTDGLATAGAAIEAAPWVGDIVLSGLGPARLGLLHGRAADAHAKGSDPGSAAARAWHLERAGRRTEAADAHAEAGRLAAAIHAHDGARRHFESALASGHPDHGMLHRAIGDVERAAGRYAAAVAAYHAAAAVATDVDLERAIGDVYRRWGRWSLAEAAFAAAEDLAGPPDLPTLLADRAEVALRSGDRTGAEALVARSLGLVDGDPVASARVRNVAGLVLDDPSHLEAAVAVARLAGLREEEAAALNNLALARLRGGDPSSALDPATRALGLLDRTGDRHRRAAVHGNLADIHHALGDDQASRHHLRTAAELFAEVGIDPGGWDPAVWKLTSW
jgi:DNA-binding SARP family transcriptional activator/tetratricopeptide (TPR) repeat protein